MFWTHHNGVLYLQHGRHRAAGLGDDTHQTFHMSTYLLYYFLRFGNDAFAVRSSRAL